MFLSKLDYSNCIWDRCVKLISSFFFFSINFFKGSQKRRKCTQPWDYVISMPPQCNSTVAIEKKIKKKDELNFALRAFRLTADDIFAESLNQTDWQFRILLWRMFYFKGLIFPFLFQDSKFSSLIFLCVCVESNSIFFSLSLSFCVYFLFRHVLAAVSISRASRKVNSKRD